MEYLNPLGEDALDFLIEAWKHLSCSSRVFRVNFLSVWACHDLWGSWDVLVLDDSFFDRDEQISCVIFFHKIANNRIASISYFREFSIWRTSGKRNGGTYIFNEHLTFFSQTFNLLLKRDFLLTLKWRKQDHHH